MHNSRPAAVALQGDVAATVDMLVTHMANWSLGKDRPWWGELRNQCEANRFATDEMAADTTVPLNYYAVFRVINSLLPRNTIVVSEGANTMDIGRTMLLNTEARRRLDAGTFGTMGVGPGFAIAAALYARDHQPGMHVVCVEGDSAFGFSGMEVETMVRYKLPIIVVVVNNNGIYGGMDNALYEDVTDGAERSLTSPPTALLPDVSYERMMDMFGQSESSSGFLCRTTDEVATAFKKALAHTDGPCILNVMINPMAQRKAQAFEWLTRSKM